MEKEEIFGYVEIELKLEGGMSIVGVNVLHDLIYVRLNTGEIRGVTIEEIETASIVGSYSDFYKGVLEVSRKTLDKIKSTQKRLCFSHHPYWIGKVQSKGKEFTVTERCKCGSERVVTLTSLMDGSSDKKSSWD